MGLITIERRRRRVVPTEDELRFEAGTRSVADLVAPASVEVGRDGLSLDGQYARTLVVTGYPRTVAPGWLNPLIEFDEPIELSLHVRPLETAHVVAALSRKLVQLHSSRLHDSAEGRLEDPERETAYGDAERLRDSLQRGDEKVFSVSLYILLRAATPTRLDELTRRVEGTLEGMMAQSRVAYMEQDSGFHSVLPEGDDRLGVPRNLDTTSLATAFPFTSGSLSMQRGVLYGTALHNRSLVIFDPFDESLENANAVVLAKSGSGKSYFVKLMALRNLMVGVDFLVIDPEDEYRTLCEAVGGQYIRLAASSTQHINPLDLPGGSGDRSEGDGLADHVASLLGWLEILLAPKGQALSPHERGLLDRALYRTYARAGITPDPDTHGKAPPRLSDLAAVLAETPSDLAGSLALRLERYVSGSLAGLFNHPTNVGLDGRFVVFNVQDVGKDLRPLVIHMISSFVWGQIRRSFRPRLLIIDEAWSLMQHEEGGAFLAGLARRARKRYLGVVTITQDIADFLGSEHGRTALSMSSVKLLMKHDGASIGAVVDVFGLSPGERRFLLGAEKGEGLFFALGGRVPIYIEASPLEHELVTTAPRELAARRQRGSLAADGGAR
ncbi:MAG: DUF87 domain-containing protein, partial [Gemmatimonadota bacterium]|nr:DUF87 domain-containing protein [Gemmatimonadota bacterium]